MTNTGILLVVLAVLVLVAGGLAAAFYARHREVRRRFGPEYQRVAAEKGTTLAVDRELRERERRHAQLQLNDLDEQTRSRYGEQWQRVQARFVESPETAIGAADELVTRLIRDRGYPVGDYDEQLSLLSVEHARVIDDYRVAHDIAQQHARGHADTEMLRQALMHYRAVVADILGTDAALKADALDDGARPGEAATGTTDTTGTTGTTAGDPRAPHHRDAKADAAAAQMPQPSDMRPVSRHAADDRAATEPDSDEETAAVRREDADTTRETAPVPQRPAGEGVSRARGTAKVPQGKATLQSGRQPADADDSEATRPRRP
jgi:hypothetical protein